LQEHLRLYIACNVTKRGILNLGDPTGKFLEHSYTSIIDSLVEVSRVLICEV